VTISLFLDVIVAILLVVTLIYSAMLNRRLTGLRSNKAELEALIHSFGEACARAEAGVKTLRSATDEATRLQAYLDRSQALRDDLSFLLDRGSSLADRLEGGVRSARTETAPRPMASAASDAEPASGRFGRSLRGESAGRTAAPAAAPSPIAEPEPIAPRVRPLRERAGLAEAAPIAATPEPVALDAAERAAERLAQRVTLGDRAPRAAGRPERPVRERSALRAALSQAAGTPAVGGDPAAAEPAPRSKAERELLQALRTRR
jgi:hypothetical protein